MWEPNLTRDSPELSPISFLLVLLLCLGLGGCSAVPLPAKSSVSVLEICSGRQNCNNGKFKIEERDSIGHAIDALSPFQSGWQSETQMVFTTGWLTYPIPEDSVLVRNREGKVTLVIWFGSGWIGAAVYEGSSQGKYFRQVSAEKIDALRVAFHITVNPTGPARKNAQAAYHHD